MANVKEIRGLKYPHHDCIRDNFLSYISSPFLVRVPQAAHVVLSVATQCHSTKPNANSVLSPNSFEIYKC